MSQQPEEDSATRPARPDASMSLLTNVMDHSLDEGYAEAAARRGVEGRSGLPRTLRAKLGLAAGLLLAALVVTVGAVQSRADAPAVAKGRQELIDRVEQDTAHADALQEQVDTLRRTVSERQREALREEGGGQAEVTGVLAGSEPVEGPGVKLVIDDAEGAGQADGQGPRSSTGFSDDGRLRDRDLQRVINGLWRAGAEAVAVNGQRLTALSAIRAAGDAILVDNKPLAPPYTVLVVGEGQPLGEAFWSGVDGRYLKVLEESYDIRVDLRVQRRVELPAAQSLITRIAEPVTTGKGTS